MKSEVFLIVGGGIAGLATAAFLARSGKRVVLVERETQLGAHSSGKNAAILRTLTPDPLLTELGRESARFLADPPPGFADHPLIDPTGLILTANGESAEALRGWAARGDAFSPVHELSGRELARLAPHFGGRADAALHLPAEGSLDVAAIVAGFARLARAAGADLRLGTTVDELLTEGRSVRGVRLASGEELEAEWTVLAAGGWAGELGARAGSRVRLRPTRRHLAVTAPDPRIDPRSPVLWAEDFYCRPESGGWLLCACDQVDVAPNDCVVDEGVLTTIAERTASHLPGSAGARPVHFWCGMRTLTTDGRFAIGPDPEVTGLYWVAGLGGHGMVASAEVGRRAAQGLMGPQGLLGTSAGPGDLAPFDPARLALAASRANPSGA